ncbi:MAG: glycosyl hydrolase family protein [Lachnospiraceae bacterium]|nr:glycosyl hydrolase family protein [Lachnospiraceae bacterium]
MKVLKVATAVLLTATLLVEPTHMYSATAATATSIKIRNGKAHHLTVGESFKIVLKKNGTVKFKSSNKKVAKVTKKGKVKALKPGKATITVKGAKKTQKVKVTVNPKSVKAVKAAAKEDGTVKVSWAKVSGVTGYEIYISKAENKGFKQVKTVKDKNATEADIANLDSGTYYFKVKAYKKVGKKMLRSSFGSKVVSEPVKIWKLAWSDEFNEKTIDTNNWSFETCDGMETWGSTEWQEYTDSEGDNYKLEDGKLVIIPRIDYNKSTKKFLYDTATSVRIHTKGKKEFKYGKMELRAKAAKGVGNYSFGWMMGADCDTNIWPKCGEIDIMEVFDQGVPQTFHIPYYNSSYSPWGGVKNYDTGLTKQMAADEYHTYTVEWTDSYLEFSVDGRYVGKFDPSKYTAEQRNHYWVFDHEFFFVLNCALYGIYPELDNTEGHEPTGWTVVNEEGDIQTLEDYFYVDYVRVYK